MENKIKEKIHKELLTKIISPAIKNIQMQNGFKQEIRFDIILENLRKFYIDGKRNPINYTGGIEAELEWLNLVLDSCKIKTK